MPDPIKKRTKNKSLLERLQVPALPQTSTWKYVIGGALIGLAFVGLGLGIVATLSGFGAIAGIPLLVGSVGVVAGICGLGGSLMAGVTGVSVAMHARESDKLKLQEYNKKLKLFNANLDHVKSLALQTNQPAKKALTTTTNRTVANKIANVNFSFNSKLLPFFKHSSLLDIAKEKLPSIQIKSILKKLS